MTVVKFEEFCPKALFHGIAQLFIIFARFMQPQPSYYLSFVYLHKKTNIGTIF